MHVAGLLKNMYYPKMRNFCSSKKWNMYSLKNDVGLKIISQKNHSSFSFHFYPSNRWLTTQPNLHCTPQACHLVALTTISGLIINHCFALPTDGHHPAQPITSNHIRWFFTVFEHWLLTSPSASHLKPLSIMSTKALYHLPNSPSGTAWPNLPLAIAQPRSSLTTLAVVNSGLGGKKWSRKQGCSCRKWQKAIEYNNGRWSETTEDCQI